MWVAAISGASKDQNIVLNDAVFLFSTSSRQFDTEFSLKVLVPYTLPQLLEKRLRFTASVQSIHRDCESFDGFIWIGGYCMEHV